MIPFSTDAHVWPLTGQTDMREGYASLSLIVQETLRRNPNGGHLFVFRGRRGDLIRILWHAGQGQRLFATRLERGRFLWPQASTGAVTISAAQLGYLLSRIARARRNTLALPKRRAEDFYVDIACRWLACAWFRLDAPSSRRSACEATEPTESRLKTAMTPSFSTAPKISVRG